MILHLHLRHFFIVYGYFLAVPVMVVEGPVATMIMAGLAARGFFNIFIVLALGMSADLISDYLYYQIGARGGQSVLPKVAKYLRLDLSAAEKFEKHFENHGNRTVFAAKLLPGLVPPVFILAGIVKYPIAKLYEAAVPAGFLWTAGLCLIGYYLGRYVHNVQRLLSGAGLVLAGAVLAFLLYQFYFGKKLAKRFVGLK